MSDSELKMKGLPKSNETESESDGSESEYEEFDLSENPMYQVLSAFLEDDEGNNICEHISKLTEAINSNSVKLNKVLDRLSGEPTKTSPGKSSSKKSSSKK
tara:strand:- start:598 stop:900 length:303 start_codon:yes stop_codon:yes gene_type:complete